MAVGAVSPPVEDETVGAGEVSVDDSGVVVAAELQAGATKKNREQNRVRDIALRRLSLWSIDITPPNLDTHVQLSVRRDSSAGYARQV
jgi:hypothetical protein